MRARHVRIIMRLRFEKEDQRVDIREKKERCACDRDFDLGGSVSIVDIVACLSYSGFVSTAISLGNECAGVVTATGLRLISCAE